MCAVETEDDCFCYTNTTLCSIDADIEVVFMIPIPDDAVVSVDTEYPMPVLVSPYR